jgi:casein kinase 1 alpha
MSNQEGLIELREGLVLGDWYKLLKKIGSGSYGEIYSALNLKSQPGERNEMVAIKFEKRDVQKEVLHVETRALNFLRGFFFMTNKDFVDVPHFAKIFYYGEFLQYKFLSMELLGPSLLFVLKLCVLFFFFQNSFGSNA